MAVRKNNKTGKWYYDTHDRYGNHLQKHGFAKKSDAQEAERLAKKSKLKTNITYGELTEEMLDEYAMHQSARTGIEFKSIYTNHIKPFLKEQELHKYERRDGEYVKQTLLKEGRTRYVVNHSLEMMKRTMNYGVKKGYIDFNPFQGIPKLKYAKKEKSYMTYEEFQVFIANVDNSMYKVFFETAFWTGLRRGELLAIQWKDIDFQKNRMYIHKHVIYPGNGSYLVLDGRKNGSGYYVELDEDLAELLHKRYESAKTIDRFNEDCYVFGDYSPLAPENPRRQLKKTLKRSGLNNNITLHSFRHSHVSYLYNHTNLSIQQIAQRIGDTVDVVLATYAHIFQTRPGEYSKQIKAAKSKLDSVSKDTSSDTDCNSADDGILS